MIQNFSFPCVNCCLSGDLDWFLETSFSELEKKVKNSCEFWIIFASFLIISWSLLYSCHCQND